MQNKKKKKYFETKYYLCSAISYYMLINKKWKIINLTNILDSRVEISILIWKLDLDYIRFGIFCVKIKYSTTDL